jgi:hypothetical protein
MALEMEEKKKEKQKEKERKISFKKKSQVKPFLSFFDWFKKEAS